MSFMDILRLEETSGEMTILKAPSIKDLIFQKLDSNSSINKKSARTWIRDRLGMDLPTVKRNIEEAMNRHDEPILGFTQDRWSHFEDRKKHKMGTSWSKEIRGGEGTGSLVPFNAINIPKIDNKKLWEQGLIQLKTPDNIEMMEIIQKIISGKIGEVDEEKDKIVTQREGINRRRPQGLSRYLVRLLTRLIANNSVSADLQNDLDDATDGYSEQFLLSISQFNDKQDLKYHQEVKTLFEREITVGERAGSTGWQLFVNWLQSEQNRNIPDRTTLQSMMQEVEGMLNREKASGGDITARIASAVQVKRYLLKIRDGTSEYDLSTEDETRLIEVLSTKLKSLIEDDDSDWKEAIKIFWDETHKEYNINKIRDNAQEKSEKRRNRDVDEILGKSLRNHFGKVQDAYNLIREYLSAFEVIENVAPLVEVINMQKEYEQIYQSMDNAEAVKKDVDAKLKLLSQDVKRDRIERITDYPSLSEGQTQRGGKGEPLTQEKIVEEITKRHKRAIGRYQKIIKINDRIIEDKQSIEKVVGEDAKKILGDILGLDPDDDRTANEIGEINRNIIRNIQIFHRKHDKFVEDVDAPKTDRDAQRKEVEDYQKALKKMQFKFLTEDLKKYEDILLSLVRKSTQTIKLLKGEGGGKVNAEVYKLLSRQRMFSQEGRAHLDELDERQRAIKQPKRKINIDSTIVQQKDDPREQIPEVVGRLDLIDMLDDLAPENLWEKQTGKFNPMGEKQGGWGRDRNKDEEEEYQYYKEKFDFLNKERKKYLKRHSNINRRRRKFIDDYFNNKGGPRMKRQAESMKKRAEKKLNKMITGVQDAYNPLIKSLNEAIAQIKSLEEET